MYICYVMSYILQIDTSGDKGLLVLSFEGKIISQKFIEDNKKQASLINILIDELLADASIEFDKIHAVAVIAGPGSYTGVRLGLATAKGICYAMNIPLIMQLKLEILSRQLYQSFSSEFYSCVLKAREKEYFIALYDNNFKTEIFPHHVSEEELKNIFSKIRNKTSISTDCIEEIRVLENENICVHSNANVDAEFWSLCCMQSFKECNFNNLSTSEPFYLKNTFIHNYMKIS